MASSAHLTKPLSSPISKPPLPAQRSRLRLTAAMARPQPAAAATLYEFLSVSETARQEEIKAAYRRQARRWHPDACSSSADKGYFAEQFMRAREAYEVLADPVRRQDYDLALKLGTAGRGSWAAALGGGRRFRRGGAQAGSGDRARFGDWEEQLDGLARRAARPGREGTWGSKMRSCAHQSPSD